MWNMILDFQKVGAYRKEMLKLDQNTYALDSMDNVTCRKSSLLTWAVIVPYPKSSQSYF